MERRYIQKWKWERLKRVNLEIDVPDLFGFISVSICKNCVVYTVVYNALFVIVVLMIWFGRYLKALEKF